MEGAVRNMIEDRRLNDRNSDHRRVSHGGTEGTEFGEGIGGLAFVNFVPL